MAEVRADEHCMEALEASSSSGHERQHTAKLLADLDDLLLAMLGTLPPAKPWQRQLRHYLGEASQQMQVLRMTISLNRGPLETVAAADDVAVILRAALPIVLNGRAETGIKMAMNFAMEMAQRVSASLRVSE